MKNLTITLLLASVLAPAGLAQTQNPAPQPETSQSDSGIRQDTKDAAHSAGKAAKKSGHKIKKGTKKVVHKGADATSKGAEKVGDKTKPSPSPTPR